MCQLMRHNVEAGHEKLDGLARPAELLSCWKSLSEDDGSERTTCGAEEGIQMEQIRD